MNDKLLLVTKEIRNLEEDFNAALSDKSISFIKEAEFATQLLSENEYLLKFAYQNKSSLISSVKNIAAIGISLNPAKKQAYLVPRKGKICLDISYMGLMDLAIQTGSIKWAKAEVVYISDTFELIGIDKPPLHKRSPFAKEKGEIIGVYVVAKTIENDYLTDTMTIDEITDIMNRSESVKSGKSSPWKTDFTEMAKKTVVKRAYKYWPKTDRMDQAIHYLNTENEEGIATDNGATAHIINGDETNPERQLLIEKCEDAAKQGADIFADFWLNTLTQKDRVTIGGAEKDRIKNEFCTITTATTEPEQTNLQDKGNDDD